MVAQDDHWLQGICEGRSNLSFPAYWQQTRQRSIKCVFFSERRRCLVKAGALSKAVFKGSHPSWPYFVNIAEKPQANAERSQQVLCLAWILTSSAQVQIAPAVIQESWLNSHSPTKPAVRNLHTYLLRVSQLWVYHTEAEHCLCLHMQRHRQKWEVKLDDRSWEKNMSWPGAILSQPSCNTALWQGRAT